MCMLALFVQQIANHDLVIKNQSFPSPRKIMLMTIQKCNMEYDSMAGKLANNTRFNQWFGEAIS